MKILFYSLKCKYCQELLLYMQKNNMVDDYHCINIDTLKKKQIPPQVTEIPTIIDNSIELPITGKYAFEYIFNKKYFNHKTNNINNWQKKRIINPDIEQDKKAINRHSTNIMDLNNFDKIEKVKENVCNKSTNKLFEKLIKKRNKDNLF